MRKNNHLERPNQWIDDRVKELGLQKTQLAEALGVTPSRVTDIIRGERLVSHLEIPQLSEFLQYPVAHVVRMLNEQPQVGEKIQVLKTRPIRVVGDVQAGVFKSAVEWPPEDCFDIDVPVDDTYARYPVFGLRVVGPSMNLKFPEGSTALFVRLLDLGEDFAVTSGRYVLVYRRNEFDEIEATIKQYEIDRQGKAWLWPRSDHPEFQTPMQVRSLTANRDEHGDEDLQIWAIVVGKYESF